MGTVKIQKQTEAEKDEFLMECFYDCGFIDSLIKNNFGIVMGRKGSGKTALAKYLEKKPENYNIHFARRISVRNISLGDTDGHKDRLNSVLFFIIIRTVKELLENGVFTDKDKRHWQDFLLQNNLQQVADYDTFFEVKKEYKTGFSLKALMSTWFVQAGGNTSVEDSTQLSRATISNTPFTLIELLKQSLPDGLKILILIDDITDYLDTADIKKLKEEISVVKDLLLSIDSYNSTFSDAGRGLRFVSLIREDVLEFMEGSNINKLRSDSLSLEWNEKSFAGLLIKRLPFFHDNLASHLSHPLESIRLQFPDDIFSQALVDFQTNRYGINFYAYMISVSFNRPRDFLMFCYAMRERLSPKNPVTFENIESAEIEYSDYFAKELRDEMFLASRILSYDLSEERLIRLIDMLSEKSEFNPSELKTKLSQYLDAKTSIGWKKIDNFIQQLWLYGIVGFKEDKDRPIQFRYIHGCASLVVHKIKNYTFFLHRGLWWFTHKRKG